MISSHSNRNALHGKGQNLYSALAKGMLSRKSTIKVIEKDLSLIGTIFELVKHDYPQLYFVDSIQYQTYSDSSVVTVKPVYNAHINNLPSLDQQINAIGQRIMSRINTSDIWSILLYFHDSICKTVTYDDIGSDAHTIVGSLIQKRAVCDGISKAFKYFCDLAGIECRIVTGKAKRTYDSFVFENHAWNKVMVQGKWYNVDVTFDLTISDFDNVRHDYFMVDDASIAKSHVENQPIDYPANSNGLDYYTINHLVVPTQKDFLSYIKAQYKKGVRYFEIKLPGTQNIDTIEEKILNLVSQALRFQCVSFKTEICSNKDMLVFGIKIS